VFNADPRILQRIANSLKRVLVIDPNPHAAKLAGELCKAMGARQVAWAAKNDRALAMAQEFDPSLILTEFLAPDLDGLEFTRQLRHSPWTARKVPVIMITAEATAASIVGARNAGVHEFLRKPFTAGDLFKRVENVMLKPRPWIEAQMYVGPDRRRFNSAEFTGARKRRSDASADPAALLVAKATG
jgi:DNA-binding response OmpR family regulator